VDDTLNPNAPTFDSTAHQTANPDGLNYRLFQMSQNSKNSLDLRTTRQILRKWQPAINTSLLSDRPICVIDTLGVKVASKTDLDQQKRAFSGL
jgi:hypothetical protein